MAKKKKNILNQFFEQSEPIVEREVVEQEVHIKEISEQEENDGQKLADEFDENPQILIGDNKGIESVSDSPIIYGSLVGLENDDQPQYPLQNETEIPNEVPENEKEDNVPEDESENEILEEIVKEEIKPRTIQSLGKAELRMYQRTGIMPK